MRAVLTIAGSDSGGGAGIQADIKTMMANGVYAMSAVTALTAQNTTGVLDILEVTPAFLEKQLEAVFTDIRPNAVKIGMVSSEKLIDVIAKCLERFRAEHVVLDPVMVSSSGTRLMGEGALESLKQRLFPLAELVTPNIPEAEILWGHPISSAQDMEEAARYLSDAFSCAVLCKGGHRMEGADDVLCRRAEEGEPIRGETEKETRIRGEAEAEKNEKVAERVEKAAALERIVWFPGRRIENPNTHGTGCTLSSAIASNLAKGWDMVTSVSRARAYLTGALQAKLDLGVGSGPLDHGFALPGEWRK